MKTWKQTGVFGLVVVFLALLGGIASTSARPQKSEADETRQPTAGQRAGASAAVVETRGRTTPTPGRVADIATCVLHPVVSVEVAPGDRVRKGQPLIVLDADEPEAEVRAKKASVEELRACLAKLKAMPRAEERAEAEAQHESAEIACKAARDYLERLESLRAHDAISVRQVNEQRTTLLRAQADERACKAHHAHLVKQPIEHEIAECAAKLAMAEAELDACEHELEHYTIFAPIDGVISWLDVAPGAVVRPGMKTWGEILDLREIDVRCEAPASQVDLFDPQQPVDIVCATGSQRFVGRIVTVGLSADRESGSVPVTVRIAGAQERLRLNVEVTASFRLRNPATSHQSTEGDLAGEPARAP